MAAEVETEGDRIWFNDGSGSFTRGSQNLTPGTQRGKQ